MAIVGTWPGSLSETFAGRRSVGVCGQLDVGVFVSIREASGYVQLCEPGVYEQTIRSQWYLY